MPRKLRDFECLQGSSPYLRFTLRDNQSTPQALAQTSLTTCVLTYYNAETRGIINSRNRQDVNHTDFTNDVKIDENGLLQWAIRPADTVIKDSTTAEGEAEEHVARFEWTWTDGNGVVQTGREEIVIRVLRIPQVTAFGDAEQTAGTVASSAAGVVI